MKEDPQELKNGLRNTLNLFQGGESRDLFRLFRT